MEVEENKVSLWLGNFESQEAFKDFLKENYDEEGDMSSKFMEAFGISWIDSDFTEAEFIGKITIESFSGFSYISSFIHNLAGIDFGKYNCIFLAYHFEYDGEVMETENMKFIGVFDYVPDAFDPTEFD